MILIIERLDWYTHTQYTYLRIKIYDSVVYSA